MVRIALLCAWMAAAVLEPPWQATPGPPTIAAVVSALRPALPYPPAQADGLPEDGNTDVVWSVRWPRPGGTRIEVLANPLHDANREHALEAERQIQAAARRAQQRSQGDYERALRDFARSGRTDDIREISLRDDGVAGERYDAESQLTVEVTEVGAPITFAVPGDRPPVAAGTRPPGVAALLRLAAHVYEEAGPDGLPGEPRYAAEQAWVVLGMAEAPEVTPVDGGGSAVTIQGRGGSPAVVVRLSGNRELVEQVVSRADWAGLARAIAG